MRARTVSAVAASLALGASLLAIMNPASSAPRPSLAAYRGLGSWVDIYDQPARSDPEGTVATMRAHGVRTVFIETSNYSRPQAILDPGPLGRLIDDAHQQGMKVVAWYLPDFAHLNRDFRRTMAAVHFQSSTGQQFDSFALDIEARVVTDPAARSRRLLTLAARIRAAVGPSYPLGAIIPDPILLEPQPGFWQGFPYQGLTQYFDVILPMSYFGSSAQGLQAAHDYTARALDLIREHTGNPAVPIHIIGGLAANLDASEVRGFVRADRERGVLGASLYDYLTTGASDWAELADVPVNFRQSPALPVAIGDQEALGNIPGGDRTHPQEVFFLAGAAPGSSDLSFQAFDVQQDEVQILVNWQPVGVVDPTQAGSWGETRTVHLEDAQLRDRGANYIAFVAAGRFPSWSTWGVRGVNLTPVATVPGAPALAATPGLGSVTLSWTAPSDGGSAVTGYNIYRGTSAGGEILLATVGTVTSFGDTSVTGGTAYYYEVSALNALGEGVRSNEVAATPT